MPMKLSVAISYCNAERHYAECRDANRREPKNCSGQVFHLKLDSFFYYEEVYCANVRPCLKVKCGPVFVLLACLSKLNVTDKT
jgi:hypothetical protein